MVCGIRNLAREALELHNAGKHAEALACAIMLAGANPGSALALNLVGYLHVHTGGVTFDAGKHAKALACAIMLSGANPGSALVLNLVGYLHVHAGGVAWNERVPGDGDDEAASALESYHFGAALDAFSAAARIAPNCVLTAVSHAEALALNDRYADAQLALLPVFSTATAKHADPVVNHVGYDAVGGSTPNQRKEEAVRKAGVLFGGDCAQRGREASLGDLSLLGGRPVAPRMHRTGTSPCPRSGS